MPESFSREWTFSIPKLMFLIMSLNRAIQRDLDSFFNNLDRSEYTIRKVSKGAFTQARAKIDETGFIRFNEIAVDTFYGAVDYNKWHGHRVLAADGSTLRLPTHDSVKKKFGECKFGHKKDKILSMATSSILYDVLNQICIDAQLTSFKNLNGKSGNEQRLLDSHLTHVRQGDLLLLDRGYPSIALFFILHAMQVDFCIRMQTKWWKDVRYFKASGEAQRIVSFKLPEKDKNKLSSYPHSLDVEIECRLVRVELEDGTIEVLCTSLLDDRKYKVEEFKDLYHLRWGVEEAYKLLKNRIELEAFSGKTANAVKQDFHAKVFLMTLCAAYAHPIEQRVREEYKADNEHKHSQKINRTNTISCTRSILIGMFLKKHYTKALDSFDNLIYNTRELVRPNRKIPRHAKERKAYCMNYKHL
ncbi:MAG: IS4 family transposase [Bacteroidales bacterium]